jgi:hypothetical protein
MKDRWHYLLLALVALGIGASFLREPGFGDDFTYWQQAFDVREQGRAAWSQHSFHDLRWPVWGVCWVLQEAFGWGLGAYWGAPLFYLVVGAWLCFGLARRLMESALAGWLSASVFLFHPLLDSVCYRPMPDLSEGVIGAGIVASWWGLMNTVLGRRAILWMVLTGLLVAVAQANRVTGVFIVPVIVIATLAFFPRRLSWAIGAAGIAVAGFAIEAWFYHGLFGDWLHSIHANMRNTGNKGTPPMDVWVFPIRFLDTMWGGNNILSRPFLLLAIAGTWFAWRQKGILGRVVAMWFVLLYLAYSCTPQPAWPLRPLIRDADRFLAGLTVPMSLLVVAGGFWLRGRIAALDRWKLPAPATVVVVILLLWLISPRTRFDRGFTSEFGEYLRQLPEGTSVFTHDAMRAMAHLCDPIAARRVSFRTSQHILLHHREHEAAAAASTEFWYVRKLIWLSMRKSMERGEFPEQPPLGSYLDEPERHWTLSRLLAKGDTPDLIFYRRRTRDVPAPEVLTAAAPEFQGILPAMPSLWKAQTGPHELTREWPVPERLRGKWVRVEIAAASDFVEAFTLRLKFRTGRTLHAQYILKPYLHAARGKDFFVFAVPAEAEQCEAELKVSRKAKAVRLDGIELVVQEPASW